MAQAERLPEHHSTLTTQTRTEKSPLEHLRVIRDFTAYKAYRKIASNIRFAIHLMHGVYLWLSLMLWVRNMKVARS